MLGERVKGINGEAIFAAGPLSVALLLGVLVRVQARYVMESTYSSRSDWHSNFFTGLSVSLVVWFFGPGSFTAERFGVTRRPDGNERERRMWSGGILIFEFCAE